MRRWISLFIAAFVMIQMFAIPETVETADAIAGSFLTLNDRYDNSLEFDHTILVAEGPLAYVYGLHPTGYIVVSADTDLPPVLAYSFTSEYETILPDGTNLLDELIATDLKDRLQNYSQQSRTMHQSRWDNLLAGTLRDRPEQWPPDGTTETDGWIETLWTQSYPYNAMCPMDPNSGNRSIAGCPAVAMAQVLNYHQTTNGTQLNDDDDYYHNYGGRTYWIDDDWEENGFPSFPELNTCLDTLQHKYRYAIIPNNDDIAALVFACGVAARQVYSSSGSGTFGVDQSVDAYTRFGFEGFSCLDNDAPDLFERISGNIMNAIPVELALVTPAWDAGHHIVVDGYNTDDYYHLNFGWGGTSNGWYVLFENIPYNLTVVEGAIVDVQRTTTYTMFPEWIPITAYMDNDIEFQIMNISNEPITIEDIIVWGDYSNEIGDANGYSILPDLPIQIESAATVACTLHINWYFEQWRMVDCFNIHAITDGYGNDIDLDINYANGDTGVQSPNLNLTSYPNPFNPETTVRFSLNARSRVELDVFDIRGRKVRTLLRETLGSGPHSVVWNGRDSNLNTVASGVYFMRLKTDNATVTHKTLLIK